MTASPLALVVLFTWPLIGLVLFWRLPPARAATWTLLIAALFLPAGLAFDPPLIPPLHRSSVACMAAMLGLLFFHSSRLRRVIPGTGLEAWIWVLIVGSFFTAITNRDSVQGLPPLSLYDGLSMSIDVLFSIWIPFYLGRSLFRSPTGLIPLFRVILLAMLVYSLLILVELRLSPQLHRWIYGYHQHQFAQTMRADGWRPMVFMSHGLAVAQFVVFGLIVSMAMWLSRTRVHRVPTSVATVYLAGIGIAMKTFSATILGGGAVAAMALLRSTWQLRLTALLSLMILLYPIARAADVFPTDTLLELAGSVSEDRRQSLEFRFKNEDALIERARQRAIFGWGGFARNRVFDAATGRDLSVTDGYWIIILGTNGLVGFTATFMLLLTPVFVILRRRRQLRSKRDRILVCGLAWLVTISVVNLLPNAEFNPFILLLSGALAGIAEELGSRRHRRRSDENEDWQDDDDDSEWDDDDEDSGPVAVRGLVGVRQRDPQSGLLPLD